jgi:hypothetical protein
LAWLADLGELWLTGGRGCPRSGLRLAWFADLGELWLLGGRGCSRSGLAWLADLGELSLLGLDWGWTGLGGFHYLGFGADRLIGDVTGLEGGVTGLVGGVTGLVGRPASWVRAWVARRGETLPLRGLSGG